MVFRRPALQGWAGLHPIADRDLRGSPGVGQRRPRSPRGGLPGGGQRLPEVYQRASQGLRAVLRVGPKASGWSSGPQGGPQGGSKGGGWACQGTRRQGQGSKGALAAMGFQQ